MQEKVTIIAEIGENHLGDWDIAASMIEQAAKNGADVVKFQSYRQSQFPPDDPEYEWFGKVALPDGKQFEFKRMAEDLGIEFMSSPFSASLARFLCEEVGCRSIKVASGVMTNFEMLDVINANAATVDRVYLSTGMATVDEIRESLKHLDRIRGVIILHCTTQYPALPEQANLRCLQTLAKEFPGHPTGYSDHTIGNLACIAAVALGATVLEKHFTLSRCLPGTDHICSMLPEELAGLRRQVDEVAELLGSGEKSPIPEELAIRDIIRSRFNEERTDQK